MTFPNFKPLIQSVYAAGRYDLSTLEGCGAFTRACSVAVYKVDKRIVMLKKSAGRTHVVDAAGRRHAADALLFLENGKGTSIDIIGNSRTPQAKPAWTVDIKPRYTPADGFVPDYGEADEPPAPPPIEPPDTFDLPARLAALESWARSFPR